MRELPAERLFFVMIVSGFGFGVVFCTTAAANAVVVVVVVVKILFLLLAVVFMCHYIGFHYEMLTSFVWPQLREYF